MINTMATTRVKEIDLPFISLLNQQNNSEVVHVTRYSNSLAQFSDRISIQDYVIQSPSLSEPTWFTAIKVIISLLQQQSFATRDRLIADRLTVLCHDALEEDEQINQESAVQFIKFFLRNPGSELPRITLTPDGTLRARWIYSKNQFFALEFTGDPYLKMVFLLSKASNKTSQPTVLSAPIDEIPVIAAQNGAKL